MCDMYKISFNSLLIETLGSKRCGDLIHSIFNKYLLTIYCVSSIIPGIEITETDRIDTVRLFVF